MYKLKLIAAAAVSLFCISISAQNIDSLWKVFNNKSLPDTSRFDAADDLRRAYDETNPDSAMIMAKKAFDFSKGMKDEHSKAIAIFGLGFEHFSAGKFREAIKYYTEALDQYKKINRKRGMANCYSNMALAHMRLGEYEDAFSKYGSALDIYDGMKDTSMQGRTYNQLAMVRDYQGRWLESLDLYYKALKLFEELKDKYGQSVILINIATIYNEMKDAKKAEEMINKALAMKKEVGDEFGEAIVYDIIAETLTDKGDYDKALEYHNKSIAVYEKYEAKEKVAAGYCAIGRVYHSKKQFQKAIEFYRKGIDLQKKYEINTDLCVSLSHIGELYVEINQPKEGIKACDEGLAISVSTGNLDAKRQNCKCLANAYEKAGDVAKALKYYKEFEAVKDSLINDENTKEATRKEMNFAFAKEQLKDSLEYLQQKKMKDLQLSEQAATIKSERAQKVALYIGLALLLVLGLVSFRSYRIKKKDNLVIARQKKEVEEKKHLIEIQKHIVEEKQKEIIDSIMYARRIQRALITSDRNVAQLLKRSKDTK